MVKKAKPIFILHNKIRSAKKINSNFIDMTIEDAELLVNSFRDAIRKRSVRPRATKGLIVKHLMEMPVGCTLFTLLTPNEITARSLKFSDSFDMKVCYAFRTYNVTNPIIERVTKVTRLK